MGSGAASQSLFAPTLRRSSANAPQRAGAAQRKMATSAGGANIPQRHARSERRHQGRARSPPATMRRRFSERAATRGRGAMEGGDEHADSTVEPITVRNRNVSGERRGQGRARSSMGYARMRGRAE
jgi:hypothetical protein